MIDFYGRFKKLCQGKNMAMTRYDPTRPELKWAQNKDPDGILVPRCRCDTGLKLLQDS